MENQMDINQLQGARGGSTYDPYLDRVRLNDQMMRVYRWMMGGKFLTLRELSMLTGDPESSVSARIRDFRKDQFGGNTVNRRRITEGTWAYQLIWNEMVKRPRLDA